INRNKPFFLACGSPACSRIPSTGKVFIYVYRLAIDARPYGVMVWVAENIQACLRIFRRAQHQWLVRDILHQAQGVFIVFVLWHTGPIRLIRLIRGRKSQLIQDLANEAEGLFRYFKRSPKEYSA
ncbi:MAG: hypothetical protein SOW60_02910, partial [Bacteroidaceae bacterium]|nr:hypothetical protein [Bacteroidaceae bacterium]